jgi:hypothetical protein
LAEVEVRDHALWIKHVRGDAALAAWLAAMPAGADVDLEVGGVRGTWRKMADGADGRPSPGLRPVTAQARTTWHALQAERGRWVALAVCADQ